MDLPVKGIDLEALAALDALQLWKQIEAQAAGNLQGFRLTRQEQDDLARRNTEHEKPLKAQPEIEDIISKASKDKTTFVWAYSTVTDFKLEHECLRVYSVEQIGKALDRIGITAERRMIAGRQQRVRVLPRYNWANDLKLAQRSTA